ARARASEAVGHEVPARHELVHEVRRPTHEAEVVVGTQLEMLSLLHEVVPREGYEEGCRDGIAGAGRAVGHDVPGGRVELHVVLLGDGADGLLEDGLRRGVVDPASAEVDTGRVLPERFDVRLSAARSHGGRVLSPVRLIHYPAATAPNSELR